jgi:hypothetical protein
LDTAAVDPIFAAAAKADQQLWLVSYSSRMRHSAANSNLDTFSSDMWLINQD